MSNAKHTLGPWIATKMGYVVTADRKNSVAVINSANDDELPNARLIASAPDLLKEMEKVVRFLADLNGSDWIKGDGAGEVDMRQRAKALQSLTFAILSKAKGE